MARTALCSANLRTFGQGFMMYANDSKGALPFGAAGNGTWAYGSSPSVCDWQGQHFEPYVGDHTVGSTPVYVYGPVWRCPAANTDMLIALGMSNVETKQVEYLRFKSSAKTPWWPRVSHIERASETPILFDSRYFGAVFAPANSAVFYNVPFIAGKVSALDTRHAEGANFLYFDGHVDWLPPQDTQADWASRFPTLTAFTWDGQ